MRTHQKPSASNTSDEPQKGGIVIYQDKQKKATLEVRLEEETVWLSQAQIAQLFGTQRAGITKHLRNIFKSKEFDPKSVRSILEHTASDGKVYKTQFYNLDAIISIGYRVNSQRATQFRIWATGVLRDHRSSSDQTRDLAQNDRANSQLENPMPVWHPSTGGLNSIKTAQKAASVGKNSRRQKSSAARSSFRNPILEVRPLIVITPDQLQHFLPVVDQQSKPARPKSLFVGSSGLGGEVSCALLFG